MLTEKNGFKNEKLDSRGGGGGGESAAHCKNSHRYAVTCMCIKYYISMAWNTVVSSLIASQGSPLMCAYIVRVRVFYSRREAFILYWLQWPLSH